MQIVTRYDVGHRFWVPRSHRMLLDKETLTYEGEVWTRDVYGFKAMAKEKQVMDICATVSKDGSVHIQYGVCTVGEEEGPWSWYDELDISNYLENEALVIAEEYAEQEMEYFGN